jgi:hypothetical protein
MIENMPHMIPVKIKALEMAIQECSRIRCPVGEWPTVKWLRVIKKEYEDKLETQK